jgi:hypothetical protein
MRVRIQVEARVVEDAVNAAGVRGDRRALVAAVYSHRVLIGHGLACRVPADVSRRA